jgi:hypothetical protein
MIATRTLLLPLPLLTPLACTPLEPFEPFFFATEKTSWIQYDPGTIPRSRNKT